MALSFFRSILSRVFGTAKKTQPTKRRKLAKENRCVLFTDLKQSTAFYQRVGDEAAFEAVEAHFEFIEAILLEHCGQLIKTVGDAVIGAFCCPVAGVKAAMEILARWNEFNSTLPEELRLEIRIGLHYGPMLIVVGENNRIDLFGNSMNLASRYEPHGGECGKGRDVVLSNAMFDAPGVKDAIETEGYEADAFSTMLKGHGEKVVYSVHRPVRLALVA